MIRIGVYGLGKISHRVIQGILYANNADLYAVCSSSLEKANAFKEEYGAKKAYDSYEEMLQDANLDMVYICTPNYLHAKHIQLALTNHKHVVCEKPMCVSTEELNDCFDYAKRQNCFSLRSSCGCSKPVDAAPASCRTACCSVPARRTRASERNSLKTTSCGRSSPCPLACSSPTQACLRRCWCLPRPARAAPTRCGSTI